MQTTDVFGWWAQRQQGSGKGIRPKELGIQHMRLRRTWIAAPPRWVLCVLCGKKNERSDVSEQQGGFRLSWWRVMWPKVLGWAHPAGPWMQLHPAGPRGAVARVSWCAGGFDLAS